MSKRKPRAPIVVTHQVLGPPIEEDLFSPADVAPGRAESNMVGPYLGDPSKGLTAADLERLRREEPPEPLHEPIPTAGDGLLITFDALWSHRLKLLADLQGVKPGKFIENLLHRAWTAGGAEAIRKARG